jgi:hypothetical protein
MENTENLHSTVSIPTAHRNPKGLDALAQRKHIHFGVAFDVNRIVDADYTQLVLSEVSISYYITFPFINTPVYSSGDSQQKIP